MKKLLIVFLMMFQLLSAQIVKQGNNYVQTKKKTTSRALGSNLFIGNDSFPIWVTENNKYYIIRVSKKTGKSYRQCVVLPN